MDPQIEKIKELLLKKASTKQKAFKNTREVFALFKESAEKLALELNHEIYLKDPLVEVKYYEKSEYEMHLKFSGDTLVFMMHTNIFSFDQNHFIHQTGYLKDDPMREFCGMIQIYNFLADSIKYNREGDLGYLVGRLFVNKEKHFFIEGKRPLSVLYNNPENCCINQETTHHILGEAIQYCLNFDLQVPPIENVTYITLEQKNLMSYSSGMPTGKMLGFRNHVDEGPAFEEQ
jgi:hypothetical protein